MTLLQILLLAVVQGLAELLPVSSSAHVIVAEKIMGLDPSSPEMTFLLVMLHTGTMLAVLIYFWKRWKILLFTSKSKRQGYLKYLLVATGVTGFVGLAIKTLIEKTVLSGVPHAEIEQLFGNLPLIAVSLFVVGLIIIYTGSKKSPEKPNDLSISRSARIGAIQGLCLPFRGFSRSGSTISMGLHLGISRAAAEEFSFALAVILTPPVILRELSRLVKSSGAHHLSELSIPTFTPGLIGMVFSFLAGLVALKWVSAWLEKGRWKFFGYYCLAASVGVMLVHQNL